MFTAELIQGIALWACISLGVFVVLMIVFGKSEGKRADKKSDDIPNFPTLPPII